MPLAALLYFFELVWGLEMDVIVDYVVVERSLVADVYASSFYYMRNLTRFRVYKVTLFIWKTVDWFINLDELISDLCLLQQRQSSSSLTSCDISPNCKCLLLKRFAWPPNQLSVLINRAY